MLANPMDVKLQFPVRKTKAQKQAFRDTVQSYAENQGYSVTVEKAPFGGRNLLIGDPEKADVLLTAHYDTCARLPFPNLITPCNFLPFIGYQLLVTVVMLLWAWGIGIGVSAVLGLISALLGDSTGETLAFGFALSPVFGLYLGLPVVVGLMLCGPANKSNANDNTSGVVAVLEILTSMPENQRSKVCFVLFDLEEAGLIGSSAYRKAHKVASSRQLVLNLDCVGEGDHIRLFPTKKLKKNRKMLTSLYRGCGYFGAKDILVHEKGFSIYPSDQANFPYGVGICALKDSKFGLYMGKIHTKRDTVLDETNIQLLRAALTTLITCGK